MQILSVSLSIYRVASTEVYYLAVLIMLLGVPRPDVWTDEPDIVEEALYFRALYRLYRREALPLGLRYRASCLHGGRYYTLKSVTVKQSAGSAPNKWWKEKDISELQNQTFISRDSIVA